MPPRVACFTGVFILVTFAPLLAQSNAVQTPPLADSLFFAGDWAGAKVAYQTFIETNPKVVPAYIRASLAAIRLGQPADALQILSAAARLEPPAAQLALVQARMAMAESVRRNVAVALTLLEKAQASGYNNVVELDGDAAFESVRGKTRFKGVRAKAFANSYPCMADPKARAFDFWVGEWDVYVRGSQQRAGTSSIQNVSGGCMILENWTSWNAPYSGKSMNFVDAATGKWKQVWAGAGRDVTHFSDGEYRDGAMRFGYENVNPQGQKVAGHFIFYNLGPNKVRQFQDATTDGGKTYQTVYDFIYVRKGSGESPMP